MHPIAAFLANPVKVAVGVLLVALFGAMAIVRMPVQLTPDVELPMIMIDTVWPGASPQEVEKEIVREQEELLKSVEGLTKMSSTCSDSSGTISLEFRVGTDLQEALLKVNSQLQQFSDYPIDAREPVIRTSDPGDNAIAWFILTARPAEDAELRDFAARHPEHQAKVDRVLRAHNEGLKAYRIQQLVAEVPEARELLPPPIDVTKFRKFAEDQIEPQFERVPGVADCGIFGGQQPELQVRVDARRLAARGLTIEDVRRALIDDNVDVSAGDFAEGKRRYLVRTLGEYRSEQQVAEQIIANPSGEPIRVGDVADVQLDYRKPDGFVRRYGVATIAVNCQRETGANVIEVMRLLRLKLSELNAGVLKREGLVLNQVYDETEYIDSAIGLVNQNIVTGSALTVIVLMLFLHLGSRAVLFSPLLAASAVLAMLVSPWFFAVTLALILLAGFWFARGALVVSLSIPISIVGTFLIMDLLGRSLNVISLAGLAFAVGMLVDNSIVVLENIVSFVQRGHPPREAARLAAIEVWGAVLASTMTTLAVFLPVLFLEGEVGQLFVDIAIAISSAVGLSLLVSIIVIPTAAARLIQHHGVEPSHTSGRSGIAARGVARLGTAAAEGIVRFNQWIQGRVRRGVAVVTCILILVGLAVWQLAPQVEYLPQGNRNLVISLVLPPPGYNVEQLRSMGEFLEAELKPYWDCDLRSDRTPLDFPPIDDMFCVAFGRTIFFGVSSQEPLKAGRLIELINTRLNGRLPGSFVAAFQTSLFSNGLSGGRSIDVEITGPELERLVALGGQILGQTMQQLPPGTQARPIPGLDLSSPEVHVQLKPRQANDLGITTRELGYAVNALIDGAYVTDYFTGGDKIDMVLLAGDAQKGSVQSLRSQYLAARNHPEPVRLDAVADVTMGAGPEEIARRERQRAITIQVTPPDSMALEQAIAVVQASIIEPLRDQGQIGGEYQIHLSGTADKLQQTWTALRGNIVLATVITYLLLAALFESWVYPLVIILSVPLGAVGGIVGLKLLGYYLMLSGGVPQALDVLTMLGFVILIGTVVNNPILIVHQALNLIRSEGLPVQEAVIESLRGRVRPIFMTTLTTVLGLAPLVLFPGAGSELYRGLGSVLLGGLLVSTLLTVALVPTVFSLSYQGIQALARWARQPRTAFRRPAEPEPMANNGDAWFPENGHERDAAESTEVAGQPRH